MPLGFIGLGKIGSPMAGRLLECGHELVVTDLNKAATDALAARGATVVASAKEVADLAETVFISLPSTNIVLSVTEQVSGGSAVKRMIDLSTSGARTARRVHDILQQKGIAAIDAPVSGGVNGAVNGTLAVMVGSSAPEFAIVRPILENIGRVFHVGEEPGSGQTMKLVNNYLSATALAVTSEAMAYGAKAGLDPAIMVDVINAGSGRNSASQDKFPKSILNGTFDFGFATGLMYKDVRLFAEEAEAAGVQLWVGAAVCQMWQWSNSQQGPASDFTTIARTLEKFAGVELRTGWKATR